MANTTTTFFSLIQPQPQGDPNQWGIHLNSDLATIDTQLNLAQYGLTPGISAQGSSAVNITLANPLSTVTTFSMSTSGKKLILPVMNNNAVASGSPNAGAVIVIQNTGATNSAQIVAQDTTTVICTIQPGQTVSLTLTSNATANGTFIVQINNVPWAVAGGTGDAITAAYNIPNTSLYDGLLLSFRAPGANTLTNPTFSPDGITAHNITQNGGAALVAGNIAGSLAEYWVRYNLANTRWELLNPTIVFPVLNPFSDATALVKNAADNTKKVILNAGAITSGATRTQNLQDVNDTFVYQASTDTLTNKTYDTAGTGNTFKINGTTINAISGNTSKVATTTGSLTSGHVATFDGSGNINDGGALPTQIMSALGVGSIIFATCSSISHSAGTTVAAGTLSPVTLGIIGASSGVQPSGDSLSGTWQALVSYTGSTSYVGLWQRTA